MVSIISLKTVDNIHGSILQKVFKPCKINNVRGYTYPRVSGERIVYKNILFVDKGRKP